jgi:hypothetical protein
MSTRAEWVNAQVGERVFHCDEVPGWGTLAERRAHEAEMRAWYAGMLRIPLGPTLRNRSVTDFACGPESLLHASACWTEAHAVDPLQFLPADEARYAEAGIVRHLTTAESYDGPQTDEAWAYNCLQHTLDWKAALQRIAATATQTLRLFEWVEVPTDTLHLHTLEEHALRNVLVDAGFAEVLFVRGDAATHPHWAHRFYASVWRRVR